MLSPSPSPPPARSLSSSPSISLSTETASSYSSPFSYADPPDPDLEDAFNDGIFPTYDGGLTGISSGKSRGNENGPIGRRQSSGQDLRVSEEMDMYGSRDAVPTLGDLMLMDLDMDRGGPSGMAVAPSPVHSGMRSAGGSITPGIATFKGKEAKNSAGIGSQSKMSMEMDLSMAVAVDMRQPFPNNGVGATYNGQSGPGYNPSISQGFVPSPRNPQTMPHSAPGSIAAFPTHTSAPLSPITPLNGTAYPGSGPYISNTPHLSIPGPSFSTPPQPLQQPISQGYISHPNSPPISNSPQRSVQGVQTSPVVRDAVGAINGMVARTSGARGKQGTSVARNAAIAPGSIGSGMYPQPVALANPSGMSYSPSPEAYPLIPTAYRPAVSTSAPPSASSNRKAPAPRRNRASDGPGTGPAAIAQLPPISAGAYPASARSAASSTGTGHSVSIRRKNVSARNMGGEGSSQEDEDTGGDGTGGSDEDGGGRGGLGGHWTAKGRRTDRLFAGVGAADRAHWNVVSPNKVELNDLPLMIRGIKRRGAKSRVETQIKFRLCLVRPTSFTPRSASMLGLQGVKQERQPGNGQISDGPSFDDALSWDRVASFKAIRLKPGLGMRRKPLRKSAGDSQEEPIRTDEDDAGVSVEETLYLSSEVVCASTGKEALACGKCLDRETKRAESRGHTRVKAPASESDGISPERSESNHRAYAKRGNLLDTQEDHIISWNCGPLVKMVNGECELAARIVCYSRHHKEKSGFRMTIRLRDREGKLIASATAPTILITDDHKTSTSKTVAPGVDPTTSGLAFDHLAGSEVQRSVTVSVTSRSDKGSRLRTRDDSVSLDGDAKSTSRAAKAKPYNRKSNADSRSVGGSATGVMSPRTGLASSGLSMTPLHGRSIPGSPNGPHTGHGAYFSMLPIPGSGTISPGILIPGADAHISPHTGFAAALPAISQRLSQWAEDRATQQHYIGGSYADVDSGMQVDDEQWAYGSTDSQPAASYDGSESYLPAQAAMQDLRLSALNGQHDYMLAPGPTSFGIPPPSLEPMMRSDTEPDFDSMLNLSPNANAADPLDFPASLPLPAAQGVWTNQGQAIGFDGVASAAPPAPMFSTQPGQQVTQPRITRVIPPEGDVQGGTEVTILGDNFTPGTMILFGNSPAVTLQLYGPTTLVCLLPPCPSGAGTVPVFVRDSLQPVPYADAGGVAVYFTYHDVSDRKLMEMALTAVGLRVTGKVVGAVEIARRIMSAPQADGRGVTNGDAADQDVDAETLAQEKLANELAQSAQSKQPESFEQAVIKFLAVFLPDAARNRRMERRLVGLATLNLINREGHTLLHLAALLGFSQLAGLLLRSGANVDIHDRNGFTALSFAAMAGRQSSVKCIIAAGARVGACTFSNETPATLALRAGHMDIVQYLHHASIGGNPSIHNRKVSIPNSDSSPDADNPSSATDSESLASADRQLGALMSPQRLTTTNDILALRQPKPQRLRSSASIAKSDATATPKPKPTAVLPATQSQSDPKSRRYSAASTERPPPYSGEDTSWLQRTLSHLPGSQIMPMAPHLKDYIPPSLWDKLPSAQLLIPNMPDLLKPGELLENTWQSQAWLAVPLSAWLTVQAKALETPGPAEQKVEPSAQAEMQDTKPATRTFVRPRLSASARKAARAKKEEKQKERGKERDKEQQTLANAPDSNAITQASTQSASVPATSPSQNVSQVEKLKPDRMLFFFWLPVLISAFLYTLATTLPMALARAILGPTLRALRSMI